MEDVIGPGEPPRPVARAEFLEKSYIFYEVPNVGPAEDEPLVLEAWVAPHLFFYDGLTDVETACLDRRWYHAASFTFQVRLRMVADVSSPVRPPSYMPRFNWQSFRFWKSGGAAYTALQMLELRASIGHHSNGQQYCPFAEGVLDEACPPFEVDDPPLDQLNYKAGGFSTNYVQAAIHRVRLAIDPATRREAGRIAGGLVLEVNPEHLFGASDLNEAGREMYGPYRARLEGEVGRHAPAPLGRAWLAGRQTLSASFEVMVPTTGGVPWDREIVEASHVFDGVGGLGLFVRYVDGQEYLNLLYLAGRTRMVQLGFVWDFSPTLEYRFNPGGSPP